MVKKEKFSAYFKSKGFYVSLLTGIAAVAAICLICYNVGIVNQKENLADLNEPLAQKDTDLNIAENITDSAKNEPEIIRQETKQQQSVQVEQPKKELPDMVEHEYYDEVGTVVVEQAENQQEAVIEKEKDTDLASGEASTGKTQETAQTENETVPVMNNEGKKLNQLSFNEEDGLLWPVIGDVIMKFSMDQGIPFKTLGQYKCNPAIIISCKVGDEVVSAADAVVTEILEDEETGITVRTQIDENYEVIYGQLADLKIQEGDTLAEGQIIGTIADPSKYYVMEGSNLYFQVLENEKSIDPLLLLR